MIFSRPGFQAIPLFQTAVIALIKCINFLLWGRKTPFFRINFNKLTLARVVLIKCWLHFLRKVLFRHVPSCIFNRYFNYFKMNRGVVMWKMSSWKMSCWRQIMGQGLPRPNCFRCSVNIRLICVIRSHYNKKRGTCKGVGWTAFQINVHKLHRRTPSQHAWHSSCIRHSERE